MTLDYILEYDAVEDATEVLEGSPVFHGQVAQEGETAVT
ncbi:MAG: hypothetical protein FD137_742 [Spirochaetes bacterium]|nr:MAG: hypothetical protein FD137_742 [Spirochaetota bacterium]